MKIFLSIVLGFVTFIACTVLTMQLSKADIASLAVQDKDFYLDKTVVAGIWARSSTYQEADVAQADFCCCQITN
ncbi:hypothetical protein F7734_06290 [Scytonema sp. UIC 10036]|uniref:hypothetical protein n=1 Tax=Scytonema sp. UIC 10036 TaxID=2304196 RepID=UPI0012DAADA6|nr:hypothetical protein [Scytonema sp. UIC 10036]MUG92086.1 hypothetical protein [Scytonema sp. UIC 10036]